MQGIAPVHTHRGWAVCVLALAAASCTHVTLPHAHRPVERDSLEHRAHGYWRFDERAAQELHIIWLAMEIGDTPGVMTVSYGFGNQCPNVEGRVVGRSVVLSSGELRGKITLVGSRRAVLTLLGDPRRFRLGKERADPLVFCE